VYEFGDDMTASILDALRISSYNQGYVKPDVVSDSSDM
jgi:hypothetical protein